MKLLELGLYKDYYDFYIVNCIDNPIAVAASYFNDSNYYL